MLFIISLFKISWLSSIVVTLIFLELVTFAFIMLKKLIKITLAFLTNNFLLIFVLIMELLFIVITYLATPYITDMVEKGCGFEEILQFLKQKFHNIIWNNITSKNINFNLPIDIATTWPLLIWIVMVIIFFIGVSEDPKKKIKEIKILLKKYIIFLWGKLLFITKTVIVIIVIVYLIYIGIIFQLKSLLIGYFSILFLRKLIEKNYYYLKGVILSWFYTGLYDLFSTLGDFLTQKCTLPYWVLIVYFILLFIKTKPRG